MMNRLHSLTGIALLLTVGGGAYSGDIYKWIDADGNVHYEDRPTAMATRMAIESRRTDQQALAERLEAAAEARAAAAKAREEAAAGQPTAEELRAAAEEKTRRCADYREKLQKMLTSRRLYRTDDNGERQYLDDSEIDQARANAQTQVEEYCGS